MIPSRSALVLLSCMTCVGFAPSAVGSSSDSYRTDLLNSLVGKTADTRLMADLPSIGSVAQVSSPKPTKDPNLDELIKDLQLPDNQKKPATKPTAKARASASNQPLWWIAIGAVLVIVAGGLLYLLRGSDRQNEAETLDSLSDDRSEESSDLENSIADVQQTDPNSNFINTNQNGHRTTTIEPLEDRPPDLSNPQLRVKPKGLRKKIVKNKNSPSSSSPIHTNAHPDTSNFSPFADEEIKTPEELTPPAKAEALEVRETTRLSKINIVDELIKDLQNPDPNKRHKAIWELAQRGDSRAMQPLVDILIDADSKQRGLILEALSQIGNRTLKPMNRALVLSLQDENPEVRKNAIRDVTRIYDMMAQISQLLRYAVDDPDLEVQETARWALSQLNRVRGLSAIDNFPNRPNSNHPEN